MRLRRYATRHHPRKDVDRRGDPGWLVAVPVAGSLTGWACAGLPRAREDATDQGRVRPETSPSRLVRYRSPVDERTLLRRAVAGAAMSLAISMFFALKWLGDAMDAEQTSWHNVAGSFLFMERSVDL